MRKILNFLTLLVLCTACDSCERDYPEIDFKLPAETQTGANTIGFLVNGKVWTNYGKHCSTYGCLENLKGSLTNGQDYYQRLGLQANMLIRENKQEKLDQNFMFSITDMDSVGNYIIDGKKYFDLVTFEDAVANKRFEVHPDKRAFQLKITKLDTVNNIAAGTFQGALYSLDNYEDSLVIKDGRFDVKLTK